MPFLFKRQKEKLGSKSTLVIVKMGGGESNENLTNLFIVIFFTYIVSSILSLIIHIGKKYLHTKFL